MRIDQSGTRGKDFYPYKPAPLWLREHFPFPPKTAFLWLELKHGRGL